MRLTRRTKTAFVAPTLACPRRGPANRHQQHPRSCSRHRNGSPIEEIITTIITAAPTHSQVAEIARCWPKRSKTPSSKFYISTSTQPLFTTVCMIDIVQQSSLSTKCGATRSPTTRHLVDYRRAERVVDADHFRTEMIGRPAFNRS